MYNVYVLVDDEWRLYGSYKTMAVAVINRNLIMHNETKIVEEEV